MRRILAPAAVLALGFTACAGTDPGTEPDRPPPIEEPGGFVQAGADAPLLPDDRLELPEFDLARYEELIAQLEGTPVVANVWGSWCPPCRAEAPELTEVAREFEGEVQFLGIDILDNREAARNFILEFDWPYPHVFDPAGAIRDGLGFIGQPVTVVYDRQGEVSFEWEGAITADQLRTEIQKVL